MTCLSGTNPDHCSMPCPGDAETMCGGPEAMDVWVAKCPAGMKRFGENCYKVTTGTQANIDEAAEACRAEGMNLFFPESEEEYKW